MNKNIVVLLLLCNYGFCQKSPLTLQGDPSNIINLKRKIRIEKQDSLKLKYLSDIAHTYLYMNLDSAYRYILKADRIAQTLPLSPSKLSFWSVCGSYYAYNVNLKKALYFHKMVRDGAIKIKNDRYIKVGTYNLIGIKRNTGDLAEELNDLYDFQLLLDSTHEKSATFYIALYGDLSSVYFALKNTQKTIEFTAKMLPYCKNEVDSLYYFQQMVDATYNLPSYHKKTLYFYTKGIQLARKLQNIQVEISLHRRISDFYIRTKSYQKALVFASKIASYSKKHGFLESIFLADLNIGKVYVSQGKYNKAIGYLNSAIIHFRKSGDQYELLNALESISKAYRSIGDYKNADQINMEFIALNDKIFAREKQQITSELEVRFQVEEKEKLLKVNQLAIALQKKQIQIEYNQKVLISIFLVIAMLLAIWAFRNYLKKNKLNNALAEEKKQVEIQAQQLSELNLLKDKLFAVIGHDLRSPIASLQLNIQQLHNATGVSPTLITSLSKLQNKVSTISDILNNLLDWSVSQIKGELLVKKTLNLHTYVKEALSLYETIIERKDLTIANQTPSDINIYFNESQLEALLRNLISNALKFTPTNGVIRIYTDLTLSNYTTLIIKDSGVGISPEKLATIFSHPTSELGTAGEQGSGLGLRVCNDILILQDGNIKIESQTGIGTKVSISFLNDNVTNSY